MLQQQAFQGGMTMIKGCLHCHTTRSDGHMPPDEVIRLFKSKGYDFLAITDHKKYNFTNFAPETGLTVIPGMEYDNGRFPCKNGLRCFHTVCIGPLKEDGNGYEQDQVLPAAEAADQWEYQPYLDEVHDRKNLTIYCHPQWSSTPARYFDQQKGNFAMEIWNSGCAMGCDMDTDAAYWDELLGMGVPIYGVATDDGHSPDQHGHGWVMVRSENNVAAILKALDAGEFYSSCGPEIYNFYVENNKACIDCSPVAKIRLHADKHPTRIQRSADGCLTHAEFELKDWTGGYDYARMTIVDKDGKYAWTNPIYLK